MTLYTKIAKGICLSMGGWGFSRGYRSNDNHKKLTSEKLFISSANAIIYATPIINIFPTIRLINRMEIEYKGLDQTNFKSSYEEFSGVCHDTF